MNAPSPAASITPSPAEVEIFFAALNLPDPAERTAYLDRACAGSPALRSWIKGELQRQLAPDTVSPGTTVETGNSLEPPHERPATVAFHAAFRPEAAGERIGAYTLVSKLGEGGFGTVWMAEQEQPVRRRVAMKIIRVGADSRETLARFAQERQALAMMDHPNIARVFDAGATPTGRPFFVMELVRGSTITEYANGFRLSVRRRLGLFREVCQAIQHAHQKGIIHRDLKPSNVLVARREEDGVAMPKVIDFGIAKALAPRPSAELTLVTMADLMLGTPLYMSPEQARSALDVDTRCDVYSLGVILHELLVGRTLLDPAGVNACRGFEEVRQMVLDSEPRRLTALLDARAADELAVVARDRLTDPGDLRRTLRGDLEWIVLRALEKDRERRYPSAQDLAADLGRYLADEPIEARPPSARYRLGKLWRRNRAKFLTAGAVTAAILVGSGISVQQAWRARAAETRARAAQTEEATQRQRAETERTAARRSEYVADIALAQDSLRANNLDRAFRLLDRHRPGAGDEGDLRGFAWRYLWGLCGGEEDNAFAELRCPANVVTFSPDGRFLAVGSLEAVTIHEVKTRAVVARLNAPDVRALLFLRDGRTLVTQSGNTLRLWRTADGAEQAAWTEGGRGPLARSADGTLLAIAGSGEVVVRDTTTWRETARLPGALAPMAFSPDGRTLATAAGEGLTLWSLDDRAVENHSPPRVLADSRDVFATGQVAYFQPRQSLVFSGDGATLIAADNGLSDRGAFVLDSWDVRSGQRTGTMPDDPARPEHTGAITTLASSPDGRLLATSSLDHSVRLWDVARRRCVGTLLGHRAEVRAVAFSPDGETLASCDRLGQVRTWSARPEQRPEPVVREAERPLAFAENGRVLVAITPRNTVAWFDADTLRPVIGREIVLDPVPHAPVAASADGRTVAQGLPAGRVKLWGPDSNAPPRTVSALPDHRPVEALALTADGKTVIAGTRGEPLRVLDLRTGGTRVLPGAGRRIILSADDRRLVTLPNAATTALAGAPPPRLGIPAGPETNAAGREAGGPVTVWDLATGTPLARLPLERSAVFDAALSPDGSRVATVASDGAIRVWDAESGAPGVVCMGHKQFVHHLAFAHDGKTLASTSDDGTVRLWDLATGRELLDIPHVGGRMTAVQFSPDDGVLAVSRVNGLQPLGTWLHHAPGFAETDR